jgi:protein O-mannosyl-transferase
MFKRLPAQRELDAVIISKYATHQINSENTSLFWKNVIAFLAIITPLLIIYSNGIHAEWHLDDFDNIVNNKNIHLKSLSWPEIERSFHGMEKSGGHISRPLSYFSFALNYYIGGLHTFGYHVVNLAIHCLTSIFLFLLIRNILVLPLFKGAYDKQAFGIALAATILWSTGPVQVSAVTYIVQRMASMAGLFYIMTLYFYLKARTLYNLRLAAIFFAISGFTALCAFGTKENTLMLPVIITIFDLLLLREVSRKNITNIFLVLGLALIIASAAALYFLDFSAIAGNYGIRPFTMVQRLLTESRIIFLYISLLLFPTPSRLMLYHDIAWSTSLFSPLTTIFSITAIGLLVVLAALLSRTRPLPAFCILFFLINHIIEGSFFSLELIFEHRNYIPSMFFFLPPVMLATHILENRTYHIFLKSLLIVGFIFAVAFQMYTTHTRNTIFQTRIDLLKDNATKTPRLSVVYHNLGVEYYNKHMYQQAYEKYLQALQEDRYMNIEQKGLTYYNLGLYFQYVAQDMKQAKVNYDEAKRYTTEINDTLTMQPIQSHVGSNGNTL